MACTPPSLVLGEPPTPTTDDPLPTSGPATAGTDESASDDVATDPTEQPLCGAGDTTCGNKIDLLFVIDNSGTMGEEQLNLAKNFPLLIDRLRSIEGPAGTTVEADVNIMVTTTDFGNPACSPTDPPGYVPARGAPVFSPCTERLERFTSRDGTTSLPQACTDVCSPVAAPTDPFIHFDRFGDNVEGGTPAQALACIGPQGIDGCGYEAPLESMLQALNPDRCWNDPSRCDDEDPPGIVNPFLREGAVLTIVIITDEADCSVRDWDIMTQQTFWETNPQTNMRAPSSALCWRAGVQCDDLDLATGEYSDCHSANKDIGGGSVDGSDAVLHPLSRYQALLQTLQSEGRVRDVVMLGVLGVPLVTEHADAPPHEPTAGGVADLVYRQWRDPDVPGGGDILPDEWADGVDAAYKQFEFGIGPGCTAFDVSNGTYTGQAIPPVRVRELCESLDRADDPSTAADETRIRCCIESICDDDFSPAIRCLTGLIQDVLTPVE